MTRKLFSGQAPKDFTVPRARGGVKKTWPARQEHRGPQETQNQIDIAEKKLRGPERPIESQGKQGYIRLTGSQARALESEGPGRGCLAVLWPEALGSGLPEA